MNRRNFIKSTVVAAFGGVMSSEGGVSNPTIQKHGTDERPCGECWSADRIIYEDVIDELNPVVKALDLSELERRFEPDSHTFGPSCYLEPIDEKFSTKMDWDVSLHIDGHTLNVNIDLIDVLNEVNTPIRVRTRV